MHVETKIQDYALTDVQASKVLGLKPQTLRNWRCLRRGPAYSKLGRRIVYLLADLEKYRIKNRIDPETD